MVLERPCLIMFFSLKFEVALDTSAMVRALPSCHGPAAIKSHTLRFHNSTTIGFNGIDMNLLLLKKRERRKET